MPAKPHPQRDQILEMYLSGQNPQQIAEELGLDRKIVGGVVYRARRDGKIPKLRGKKTLNRLLAKTGLRYGGAAFLRDELSPEQQEWLVEECVKLKVDTIMEYLLELVRDEYENQKETRDD